MRLYGIPESRNKDQENSMTVLSDNVLNKFPDVHVNFDCIEKVYRIERNLQDPSMFNSE